jgi:hypothetical protein
MATTTYGSPYVQSSDLVSGWPTASQNVANRIDDVALKGNGVNAQTGAGYTLVLTDAGKTVTVSNGSAQNLTIPTNASVAFPTGTLIRVVNIGAGTWTLTGTPTINGTTAIPNKGAVQLLKTGTDTWWASAMDTAVGGGLTYITSSSFSASSAVNVNNCFTSTYDNYRVILTVVGSTTVNLQLRMRVSAADATGANYTYQDLKADGATVAGARASSQTVGIIGYTVNTDPNAYSLDVYRPAIATPTAIRSVSVYGYTSATIWDNAITHSLSTAYDGFSIIPSTGTITGTVRVYGYRNS